MTCHKTIKQHVVNAPVPCKLLSLFSNCISAPEKTGCSQEALYLLGKQNKNLWFEITHRPEAKLHLTSEPKEFRGNPKEVNKQEAFSEVDWTNHEG